MTFVDVEVDISQGLPSFDIVGLPDTSVREAKERVLSAIKNVGFELPDGKVTVNLSPASTRKEGAVFEDKNIPLKVFSFKVNAYICKK